MTIVVKITVAMRPIGVRERPVFVPVVHAAFIIPVEEPVQAERTEGADVVDSPMQIS